MPILVANSGGTAGSNRSWDLTDYNAKAGSYPARIVDGLHAEGIEETDFNDKSKTYEVDKVRFLIAYTNDKDEIILAQTNEMTLSSNPKSNLIKCLTQLRGKQPPLDGTFDCFEVIGSLCDVTIQERTSKQGSVYGYAHAMTPLNAKLHDDAPDLDEVDIPGGRKSEIPEHIQDQAEEEEEEQEEKPAPKKRARKKAPAKKAEKDPF